MTESDPYHRIYSVSELNSEVRNMLESGLGLIWIEAELSNLARPSSGHWYFSLKDSSAQVRCAMFKNRNRFLNFSPADGIQVLVRARVSLYEPRGDFQLIVEHMEAAGDGALRLEFERLKQQLEKEGLFSNAHKQSLPPLPDQIGIVSSATGAAIRDILHVLKRRFPAIPVIVYPVPVQGVSAAEKIVLMVEKAARRHECDVLILARGGGSLEDLWAFNNETLARAIFECQIPVITGIGHETDFTIADFVADVRAPTPSAAAELATPDQDEWISRLSGFETRLFSLIQRCHQTFIQRADWLERRLHQQHPGKRIRDQAMSLKALERRFRLSMSGIIAQRKTDLSHLTDRLYTRNPSNLIPEYHKVIDSLEKQLGIMSAHVIKLKRERMETLTYALNTLNPLSTLKRGYSITRNLERNEIIHSTSQVDDGDLLETRLEDGTVISKVKHV